MACPSASDWQIPLSSGLHSVPMPSGGPHIAGEAAGEKNVFVVDSGADGDLPEEEQAGMERTSRRPRQV